MTSDNHVTGLVSDAIERVKVCLERTGAIESGHGVLLTLCRTDDLRTILEAKEQAPVHSPQSSEAVERLREALSDLHVAVRDLGDRDPTSKLTYFEESPTKNDECHRRWVRLNVAQVEARAALQHPAKEMGK